ncbi:tripartite tricarboxylate transporter substrate binding protein [Verticiella sediminum]|uniref:Tripartite tricarboxylate transporter substrate binding protein n=1 Tax=Verticiella sediminum TaxID=1247510 RepID=A0A556AIM8_9BURK|nr:tripartite tricarboxylate transporter substrate binding protein [Verticiella sediminum]TSH92753.1 tripartite tricarboxylate transporter substrate binding protein [Verticiella sediminum]
METRKQRAPATTDAIAPPRRRALSSLIFVAVGTLLVVAYSPAHSADNRPIRLVVAYSAGGSIDLAARRIADELSVRLGQQVIVENRVGANGVVASEYVARSTPDGTTVLFTTMPAHAGNQSAYKTLPYDTIKDFAPVTVLSIVPLVLVARPTLPANNFDELMRLAREKPGQINYASFGIGGTAHLAGVQMNLLGGTEMSHIPYKGGGPAMADVVGGHVDLYFSGVASALPYIKDGRLKPLAVSSRERVSSLPDTPAIAEVQGFESFEAVVSPIMLVPARTPRQTIDRLHAATLKVTQTAKYREQLEAAGEGEPRATTPDESRAMLENEVAHLAGLFMAAGIQPE